MKRTTKAATGLVALVAVLALGVFSAEQASATSLFLYTGPLPGKILFLSDNTQTLTVEPGNLTAVINCKHFGGEIEVPATSMSSTTVKATGGYHECKIASTGGAAIVSAIEYEISASGLIKVLKPITITAASAGCTIKVSTAGNEKLEKLLFLNNADGTLLIHSDVNNIHTNVEGGNGVCGKVGTERTEGSYTGLVRVFAHNGGTVIWDP